MKTFVFTNDDQSYRVEIRTNLEKGQDNTTNFTILQIIGLEDHEEKSGVKSQQNHGNTVKEMTDFATANNLKLVEIDEDAETTLVAIDTAFAITTGATMTAGTDSVAYDQDVEAEGGSGDYTFSLESGDLPDGLSLAADGQISGTPTVQNTFNFTVRCTDSFTQSITKALSITINA